jgi:hypothetical protein
VSGGASNRYATTYAVRAGHDAPPGRLRGRGGGGLRRYAHDDGPVTAASPTPRQRAAAEAAAIVRAFAVPPGGQRLQQAPGALKVPISTLGMTATVADLDPAELVSAARIWPNCSARSAGSSQRSTALPCLTLWPGT